MTLNVDWSKVKDADTLMWKRSSPAETSGMMNLSRWVEDENGVRYYEVMTPISHSIVWATMHVGMYQITEGNIDEFFRRAQMYYDVLGEPLYIWDPENPSANERGFREYRWSYNDLKAHIGLSTNASTLSKAAFSRGLISMLESEATRKLRAAKAESKAEVPSD